MNHLGLSILAIVLLSAALFMFTPRRYGHWAVVTFFVLVVVIVVLNLPIKLLFMFLAALLLWVGSFIWTDKKRNEK